MDATDGGSGGATTSGGCARSAPVRRPGRLLGGTAVIAFACVLAACAGDGAGVRARRAVEAVEAAQPATTAEADGDGSVPPDGEPAANQSTTAAPPTTPAATAAPTTTVLRLPVPITVAPPTSDTATTTGPTTSTPAPAIGVSVFDLEVGMCTLDEFDPDDVELDTVPVVDCAVPHDNEVYEVFDLDANVGPVEPGAPYPGIDAVAAAGELRCLTAFEPYVGAPVDESTLTFIVYLSPSAGTWADGDREVVCALYDPDFEQLVGSVRGTGR